MLLAPPPPPPPGKAKGGVGEGACWCGRPPPPPPDQREYQRGGIQSGLFTGASAMFSLSGIRALDTLCEGITRGAVCLGSRSGLSWLRTSRRVLSTLSPLPHFLPHFLHLSKCRGTAGPATTTIINVCVYWQMAALTATPEHCSARLWRRMCRACAKLQLHETDLLRLGSLIITFVCSDVSLCHRARNRSSHSIIFQLLPLALHFIWEFRTFHASTLSVWVM